MAEENERPNPDEKGRRFRITRKVKEPVIPESEGSKAMREAEQEEEALRGSREFQQFTTRGCKGCLNLTLLIFVIMLASIIGTCAFKNNPPGFLKL
jgi:hypothetical protein